MTASNEDVLRAALEQIRDLAARSDAHPDIEVGTIARAALTASSDASADAPELVRNDRIERALVLLGSIREEAVSEEHGRVGSFSRIFAWAQEARVVLGLAWRPQDNPQAVALAADGPSVEASPGHVICPVCKGDGTGAPIGADGCGRCGGEGEVPLSQAKGAPSDDVGGTAQEQVDRLARFILDEVPGEPSQSQGAVDTAIRLIRAQRGFLDDIAHTVDLDEVESYDDVCRAVERLSGGSAGAVLDHADLEALRDLLRYLGCGINGKESMGYQKYRDVWDAGRAAVSKVERLYRSAHADTTERA